MEDLAGDRLRLVGAERDDDGETFAGSSGSKPSGGASIWNVSSVIRVRAFGARQLTVTP